MKSLRAFLCLVVITLAAVCLAAGQALTLEGLRLANHQGSFKAAQYTPDGSLILLYDQGDGLRLLKTDAKAETIKVQIQEGSTGDSGLALALDPSGNIYVVGTSASGALSGTAGAAFTQAADASTNSFLAKFDSNLKLLFLTFLGTGKTVAVAVAASSDAAFVTGVTYSNTLPVTNGVIQPIPASGSTINGFVERFSINGTTLTYATYLSGAGGDTLPSAIAVDSADNAYITGQTAAPGFPAVAALQPVMSGATSGFVAKLQPGGDALAFSTFIPGTGLTSLTLDPGTNTLLLTGNVSLGQFPVATVAGPIANTPYQTLLRLSEDGQTMPESVLLAPGTQSFASAGPNGIAWVSGALGPPLFPSGAASRATPNPVFGDSFLLHVTQTGALDQTLRFGGLPVANASFAHLTSNVAAPAISADGSTATVPGTLTAAASASLTASQRFDLPLTQPTAALPNATGDLLPPTCGSLSQCTGSGGFLATVTTGATATALSLSTGDLPNLTLSNAGTAAALNLVITASGYSFTTNCDNTLSPAAQCAIALTGTGPGSISVSATNAPQLTAALPLNTANPAAPDALALSVAELDFGVVTAADSPVTRSLTVTNLSGSAQTFASAPDGVPANSPYTLAEMQSTCSGPSNAHVVNANSSCSVALELSASTAAANDGPVSAAWKIGRRDVAITGITQAAALSLSAAEIDFGVHLAGSAIPLPRFLYLSNSSSAPLAHTPVSLPGDSPFGVTDGCPSALQADSVCQITLTYTPSTPPSADATTLTLDNGLTVLVTGETRAAPTAGQGLNPNLTISPASFSFAEPVVTSEISSETGVFTLTNTGTAAVSLLPVETGDFLLANGCASALSPGARCELTILLSPSQPGFREGWLSIATGSGFAPISIPLSGTGTPLLPSNNGTLSLGQSLIGEPAVAWYRVQTSVPNLTASVAGSAFGVAFVEDNGDGHGSLPISAFSPAVSGRCAVCWLGIQLLPQAVGPATGTLTLTTQTGGHPYQLAVTGDGEPMQGLVLTPASQDFGTVPVGSTSAAMIFTLANLLTPAASATGESVTTTGDFNLVANTTGGASCTGALASTASCYIAVSFAPTATGPRSGTLTVTTSSGVSTVNLSGSAVANPGLELSPTSFSFNNEPASASAQKIMTLTNSGPIPLSIGRLILSNPSFAASSTCATLSPGASCTVAVAFTPADSDSSGTLSFSVTANAAGQPPPVTYSVPLTATYTGDETGLLLLPSQANFGAQATGSLGQTRQFTLENTSSAAETVVLTVPQQFPLAAPFTCGTLAAGANCTFSVSFLPESGGALTGSLLATATSPTGSFSEALGYLLGYGTATGSIVISGQPIPNAPVNFGQVTSGESTSQTLFLTNPGSAPITIRRIVTSPPFFATSTCGQMLTPEAICSVSLTYAPIDQLSNTATSLAPRTDTETLIVESDASSSPDQVQLSGTALPIVSDSPDNAPILTSYTLSQGALTFANTQVGNSSPAQTLTLSNRGTAALTIGAVFAPADYASRTDCATLLPSASCSITVNFVPGSGSSSALRAGTLEIQSNASDALQFVSLLGMSSAAPLTLSPGSLDFGTVNVGQSGQLSVTATNTASLPITFGQLSATGDYTVAPGTCPQPGASLPAGQSCSLVLTFAPTATGTRSGMLSVSTDATQLPLTVALIGAAVAAKLETSPGILAFGTVNLGVSAILTLNLVNSGSASLTGLTSAVIGPNASDFTVTAPCPLAALSPATGCTMEVTFTPSALGVRSASLVVASSDPSSPAVIPLTGTGPPGASFALTVNGGTSSTATVGSGAPATFPLTLTPQGGYTGPVALTCAPVNAAPYAACSLLAPQLMLSGGPQAATATITTVGSVSSSQLSPLTMLLAAPLTLLLCRRRSCGLQKSCMLALVAAGTMVCLSVTACGGPGASGQNMTPPGTYQYRVTANSTSGLPVSSSVTLSVVVQ